MEKEETKEGRKVSGALEEERRRIGGGKEGGTDRVGELEKERKEEQRE